MKNSLTKIATLSALLFASININATIITGDLSYDDQLTHTITGNNGLTYIGWAEAAVYNYQQTLNATRVGGSLKVIILQTKLRLLIFLD